ncbi:MAG TPA: PKD domain-containing protein [Mycobacterium sp.]|nr:PKD domain-containing protein [Mycobacterium sp.]
MVARAAGAMLSVTLLAALAACDKVPLTAPTESTITLYANGNSVPLNGGVDVIATVIEDAGTPVQNGTVVTFTTTLGRFDPAEARTNGGKATARLLADGRSGTATVFATSGGAKSEELTLPVGGAAAKSIVLRANPSTVSGTGGTVQVVATVRDEGGNGLPGVLVSFSADAGQLSNGSATTDAKGEARVSLTTARTTKVTANAGAQSGEITITYIASPTVSVTVTPTAPAVGETVVFAITVTPPADGAPIQSITVDFDDGSSINVGSSSTSVAHVYSRGGTYEVTVEVRDVMGQTTEQVVVVVVQGVVNVSLSATPDTITAPAEVTFVASVSGATATSYRWDFGDGSPTQSGTSNTIKHTYAAPTTSPTTRTATVTVTTSDGSSGTAQATVTLN